MNDDVSNLDMLIESLNFDKFASDIRNIDRNEERIEKINRIIKEVSK
jgi:hypothetical protein